MQDFGHQQYVGPVVHRVTPNYLQATRTSKHHIIYNIDILKFHAAVWHFRGFTFRGLNMQPDEFLCLDDFGDVYCIQDKYG